MSAITNHTSEAWRFSAKAKLAAVLGAWLALAVWAGQSGILSTGPDTLVRPVLLSVAVPVAIFLALFAGSAGFRRFILTRDIRVVTMLQSWRVIGFAFLPLYAYGVLPGLFAWPAGAPGRRNTVRGRCGAPRGDGEDRIMADKSGDARGGAGPSRRDLFRAGAMGLTAAAAATLPGLARADTGDTTSPYVPVPGRPDVTLTVDHTALKPDGKKEVNGNTVNGVYPGPEIRVRDGQQLRIRLKNYLRDQFTLIHWHGLLVPAVMDGVPYVAADPIHTGGIFDYDYTVLQSGTYWYHSHYGLQEQLGLAGPIIIEPKREPMRYDSEYIIFLTDWTHQDPYLIVPNLKKAAAKRGEESMDMASGPDLSDVKYDAFLMNGRANHDPWKASARPGDRIRFRIIDAGTSTFFRFMIDGHALTITHADGPAVQLVEVDNILIGMAETYRVMVTMGPSGSYTIRAEAQDGSGQAIGVLHTPDAKPKANLSAPNWGPRLLSYAQLRALEPTSPPLGARNTIVLDLMGDMSTYTWTINGFVYPTPDPKISARPQDPPEALVITSGDRVSVSMKNRTKMWHPMHLHGHFFRLLSPGLDDEFRPLKHTVNVPPGALVRFEFVADNPGR